MVLKSGTKQGQNSQKNHKAVRALRILRTSNGAIKRTGRTTGFVKANVISQASNRVLQRIGVKRKGKRQMQRERVIKNKEKITQIKEKKKQAEDQDDDDIKHEGNKTTFFDVADELILTKEDEKLLEQFKSTSNKKQTTIAQNIAEQFESNLKSQQDKEYEKNYLTNPKILLVYGDLAELLKSYRSGKLPQPFHIIPTVAYWQDLIKLTKPEEWTPQAMNTATKIFSSSMNNEKAEYFFKDIILPAVRESIHQDKKLNYHYYNALIKGLYKPQAWFKGILFHLCSQPDFTLKEAQIIGSIIHKQSIPSIHGSIVIYKLLQFPFSGPIAIILKVMIDKQYSLPQRVVNEVVSYFLKFSTEEQEMPVIWHQSLLKFTELYQSAFSVEQKKEIKNLTQKKNHYLISPEVVKALLGLSKTKTTLMDLEK